DLTILRSAVPLPRDQRTLEAVRELRSSLREAQALRDVANFREAWSRAAALLPRVEAANYQPLVGEILELMGSTAPSDDVAAIEQTLQRALFSAESAHDDVTAARAAGGLAYVVGVRLNRPKEAEAWTRLSESIIDRLGPGHDRLRSWTLNNFSLVLLLNGDLERAENLARRAITLK